MFYNSLQLRFMWSYGPWAVRKINTGQFPYYNTLVKFCFLNKKKKLDHNTCIHNPCNVHNGRGTVSPLLTRHRCNVHNGWGTVSPLLTRHRFNVHNGRGTVSPLHTRHRCNVHNGWGTVSPLHTRYRFNVSF